MKKLALMTILCSFAAFCRAAAASVEAVKSGPVFEAQLAGPSRLLLGETQRFKEASEDFHRYCGFSCQEIAARKDGGTIILRGLINRSLAATIRYDGKIHSPTRGQFFVTLTPSPELPMTKDELKGLAVAVEREILNPEGRNKLTYQDFLRHIQKALSAD